MILDKSDGSQLFAKLIDDKHSLKKSLLRRIENFHSCCSVAEEPSSASHHFPKTIEISWEKYNCSRDTWENEPQPLTSGQQSQPPL